MAQFAQEWKAMSVVQAKDAPELTVKNVARAQLAPPKAARVDSAPAADAPLGLGLMTAASAPASPTLLLPPLAVNATHGMNEIETAPVLVAALTAFLTAHPDHDDVQVVLLAPSQALADAVQRGVRDSRLRVERAATYTQLLEGDEARCPGYAVVDCTWRLQPVPDAPSSSAVALLLQNGRDALQMLVDQALGTSRAAGQVGQSVVVDIASCRPAQLQVARPLRYFVCTVTPNVNPAKSQPIADKALALKGFVLCVSFLPPPLTQVFSLPLGFSAARCLRLCIGRVL